MREKKSEWMEMPMQANINVTSDHVQFGLRRRWSNLNTSKIIDQVSVSNWISWPSIGHGVVFHYLMISLSPNTLSHIIFLRRHADVCWKLNRSRRITVQWSEHPKNIMNRRLPGQEIKAMHARQRLDESQSVRAQTLESVVAWDRGFIDRPSGQPVV